MTETELITIFERARGDVRIHVQRFDCIGEDGAPESLIEAIIDLPNGRTVLARAQLSALGDLIQAARIHIREG